MAKRTAAANFKKITDNTGRGWERTQLHYQGAIAGRNAAIVYQFQVLRLLRSHELATTTARETHQFITVYRDAKDNFRCLFAFRFDCRLGIQHDRNPDRVAANIAEFLALLLVDAARSPIGILAVVVCQESLDFWVAAFEHKVIALSNEFEKGDKDRLDQYLS